MRTIDRIVIHHSASDRSVSAEEIRGWHLARGFSDIGYHVVIEERGNAVPGRSFEIAGAHARGFNDTSIGICVVGDNTNPYRKWNERQVSTLRTLVAVIVATSRDIEILGHRDLPGTATLCPGLDIRELIHRR